MFGGGGTTDRFQDRADAGRQLAEALEAAAADADIVLAIPRGGLPLGRAVADALGVPLDIVVASKISAPNNPEFAIGAAASDGTVWLDDRTIDRLGINPAYVDRTRQQEVENARQKAERYRGGSAPPTLEGRTVVIVDDGVATGSTATAAIRLVRESGAKRVVLAVPVGPPDTISELAAITDEVLCLRRPQQFSAVGQFYRRFDQVSDEAAMGYLDID